MLVSGQHDHGGAVTAAHAADATRQLLHELLEERAAIIEFDGNVTRAEADRMAWLQYHEACERRRAERQKAGK